MIESQYIVKEVAKIFKKDKRTIRRWIEEGVFPNAKKIKGEHYVPESDIQKLLNPKPPQEAAPRSTRRVLSSGVN